MTDDLTPSDPEFYEQTPPALDRVENSELSGGSPEDLLDTGGTEPPSREFTADEIARGEDGTVVEGLDD